MSEETIERTRRHKIILDCADWAHAGSDYTVTLTIDEARLDDVIGRAISRHDGRTVLAGGGVVIEVTKLAKPEGS